MPIVVDGDTIEIHGQRIRLDGIDAPESAQLCRDSVRKPYRCGQKASFALADFLEGHRQTYCVEVDRDHYGRIVAVCTAGGIDIADWMVRRGYAVDWPRFSDGFYSDAQMEAQARQYIRRHGIGFRDLLQREPRAPAWRDLLRVYRRLEMRGDLRGGRIVSGFVGEQFAAPEALEALRAIRREPPSGQTVSVSACDPLNLVGVVTPGPRVAAVLGHRVTYRDGVPVDEARGRAERVGGRKRR